MLGGIHLCIHPPQEADAKVDAGWHPPLHPPTPGDEGWKVARGMVEDEECKAKDDTARAKDEGPKH